MTQKIGTIAFSLQGVGFRYDMGTNYLECLGGRGMSLTGSKAGQILSTLIRALPRLATKEQLLDAIGSPMEGSLQRHVTSARKVFSDLASERDLKTKDLIRNLYAQGYILDFEDYDIQQQICDVTEPFEVDMDEVFAERRGQENIRLLILDLLALFPKELEDFFAKSRFGARMPYFELDREIFGPPSFPMAIENTELARPDRGERSLVRIREAQKKEIYPGQIYRLVEAKAGAWRLGKTLYTHIVDDCDYLRSNILSGWGRLCEADPETRMTFLRTSPIVKEWLDRVERIKQGDFSQYLAGIGFCTPILREVPNGTLEILYAKGSLVKQAGGGQLHVCPAGMLEYGLGAVDAEHLTAIDFSTYALKEMIEETLRHDAFKENRRVEFLDAKRGAGDFMNAEALRSYCESILEGLALQISTANPNIRAEDGTANLLSLEAAKQSLHLHETLSDRPLHVVVDAFALRPEIIVPIFVTERIDLLLSWENDAVDRHVFSDVHDVESLARNMGAWTSPGLAASYLTALEWSDRHA